MVKREVVNTEYISILEHIADVMKLETNKENKLVDFKPGDIVKSSILQGLYKVEIIGPSAILVSSIREDGPCYPIHPKYLKKVETNKNTVDILYNGR